MSMQEKNRIIHSTMFALEDEERNHSEVIMIAAMYLDQDGIFITPESLVNAAASGDKYAHSLFTTAQEGLFLCAFAGSDFAAKLLKKYYEDFPNPLQALNEQSLFILRKYVYSSTGGA